MGELKIEYWPLSKLKRWPRNPKAHDDDAIRGSIDKFDFNDPIGVNTRTGQIVEGHGRLDVLQQRKAAGEPPPFHIEEDGEKVSYIRLSGDEWLVPVLPLDMDERTAEKYALAHNRTTELGGWNEEVLAEVLSDLAAEDDLDGIGWSVEEMDEMLKEEKLPEFPEYDESVADEVEYLECPECGHKWPK